MTLGQGLEQYQAAFEAIAKAVQQMPEDQRREISVQLGEYTHDLKHLLGVVIGANAVLMRTAPADDKGARVLEMVGIIEDAAVQLDSLIELIVEQLYLPTRLESDQE